MSSKDSPDTDLVTHGIIVTYSMRVQGSHSRKSLPSQQLLTTSVSLREKKRKGALCLLSACISGGTVRRPSL